MRTLKASDFPELQRVFAGYLHEDFLEEHGSPAEALRAFQQDASPAERRRFHGELLRLAEGVAVMPLKELRALLAALGSRWNPPSRKSLIELLRDLAVKDLP